MTQHLAIEHLEGHPDFRHLSTIEGIGVDLRYATLDNFVGRDLYSPYDCAWLHVEAAAALERAVAWLAERKPGYSMLVLDALRPQRVQEQLWAALEGTDLRMYLADPARGSIHSFGMALDLTIVDELGNELDMGSGFDELSERSHPILEGRMLEAGAIQPHHVENRTLLRGAMFGAGFVGINSEWWHFDCGSRDRVRATFSRVL